VNFSESSFADDAMDCEIIQVDAHFQLVVLPLTESGELGAGFHHETVTVIPRKIR
jgi:hypothetical protein